MAMARRSVALAAFLATLPAVTAATIPPDDIDTDGNHNVPGWRQTLRRVPLDGRERHPGPNPEEALIQRGEGPTLLDRLEDALESLPNGPLGTEDYRMRDVVLALYVDGCSGREAAQRLELSEETVWRRHRRALEMLRRTLTEHDEFTDGRS